MLNFSKKDTVSSLIAQVQVLETENDMELQARELAINQLKSLEQESAFINLCAKIVPQLNTRQVEIQIRGI